MNDFEKLLTVRDDDLDDLQHVNNVRYVQWIQDVSKEHWTSVAPEDIRSQSIWVVMSHHISYKSAAKLGDTIRINTSIAKSKGALSERVVEMHNDKTNELLLRSTTEWCLLNARTQRPMRIPDAVKKLFEAQA
ncbi:acyl-CoA thioesterase [Maribacter algicola]|uniref:Acyl-CoA thioesterase n=1 Tax=Meishania litoralis TaxID=3434685 RepID=A0ACC7LKS6_9FLAO